MGMGILATSMMLAMMGVPLTGATQPVVRLQDQLPFGVFWAWERCKFNAEHAGITIPEYAEKTLKLLRDMNCDAVWFVHGPGKEAAPWAMPMMEKYGLKGMVASDLINFYYDGAISRGLDFVEKRADDSAAVYAQYPSLLGYVLKDEPLYCNVQHTDYFFETMHRADPAHDAAVIAMPHQFQAYIEDTSLPVVCTDIYHFGGEGSRWIPQPSHVSKASYRKTVHNAVTAAARRGKHAWIMPMVFGNTWGPNYWDKDGRHWALPGCYFHWRMPTPAEARWQVWEAIRGGAKGVIFYLLNDSPRATEADMLPESPRYKKVMAEMKGYKLVEKFGEKVLSQEKKELDPARALTFPGGDPTEQFKAVGEAFGALAPHKGILLKSRRALFPVFFPADGVFQAQTFQRDGDKARLGIIVNDDVVARRTVRVRVAKNVCRVIDLNGGDLEIETSSNGLFNSFELTLEPGSGAILAASFADGRAGFPLMREDFSNGKTKGAVNADVAEQTRFTMFGIGADWQLKLKKGADGSKPAFTLSRLTNAKSANNTVFMNLNRRKRNGTVFLDLNGDLETTEVTAVLDAKAVAEETDVLHTGQKDAVSDSKDALRRVIWKSGDMLPAVVPVGTTGLEFRLGSPKDSLREVVLWFVPDAGGGK